GSMVNGNGLVLVVSTADASNPTVLKSLTIPGMSVVTGIVVNGNSAFVIGSSLGWKDGVSGMAGNLVVATLDLSDPQNPVIVSTQTTNPPPLGIGFVNSLGSNQYVTTSVDPAGNQPQLLVLDASDPANVIVTKVSVPQSLAGTTQAVA